MAESSIFEQVALLDNLHLSGLREEVHQTIRDKSRGERVLNRLLARDAFIMVLEAYSERQGADFAIDVRGGFGAADWRRELLNLVDISVNGRLVTNFPTRRGATSLWLSQAQVESQAAPDICVAVALEKVAKGVNGELLGWETIQRIREMPRDSHGTREIRIARLEKAQSIFSSLLKWPERARQADVTPKSSTMQELWTMLNSLDTKSRTGKQQVFPLSQVDPDVFDCLVVDSLLAEKYMAAVAATRDARMHVRAPEEWLIRVPNLDIADWLGQLAENAHDKASAFWKGLMVSLPPLQSQFAGAATILPKQLHVLNASAPERQVLFRIEPQIDLLHKEGESFLRLFLQTEKPITSAYLLVLGKKDVDELNRLLENNLEAGPLIREVLRNSQRVEEYVDRNVIVYQATVRGDSFVELGVPLPGDLSSLPPDITFALVIQAKED